MDDKSRRKLETFIRVDTFGSEHNDDFAENSIGKQLFTEISTIVDKLGGHASTEASARGIARHGTSSRGAAREELLSDLKAISRTARALAFRVPGIDDRFPFSRNISDQQLLAAARAVAVNAVPFSAQFIALELPADFLDDLNDDIEAMEGAINEQTSGKGDHIAARAEMEATIEEGVAAIRQLDVIIKNKYANRPGVQAEWLSASHTERGPRRKRVEPQPQLASGSGSTSTPPNPAS